MFATQEPRLFFGAIIQLLSQQTFTLQQLSTHARAQANRIPFDRARITVDVKQIHLRWCERIRVRDCENRVLLQGLLESEL